MDRIECQRFPHRHETRADVKERPAAVVDLEGKWHPVRAHAGNLLRRNVIIDGPSPIAQDYFVHSTLAQKYFSAPARHRTDSCQLATSDLHEPKLFHLTDRQHGAHRIDMLVGREDLYDEILKLRQVFSHAMQQEIAVSGDHPGLAHQRPRTRRDSKGLQIGFRLMLQADHGEGDEIEAEHGSIEKRAVTFDDPALFQPPDPSETGRRRNTDACGQFDIGHATVVLQFSKNFDIDRIQIGTKHEAPHLTALAFLHQSAHPEQENFKKPNENCPSAGLYCW